MQESLRNMLSKVAGFPSNSMVICLPKTGFAELDEISWEATFFFGDATR